MFDLAEEKGCGLNPFGFKFGSAHSLSVKKYVSFEV
jgi:hypothetical protein